MRLTLLFVAVLIAAGCQKPPAQHSQEPAAAPAEAPKPAEPAPSPAGAMQGTREAPAAAPTSTAQANEPRVDDPQIVIDRIHAINQDEIHAGQLALKQGTKLVHSYAERLVKDHTRADRELTDVAKQAKLSVQDPSSVQWPAEIEQGMAQDKTQMGALQNLSGSEFDAQFLSMMVAGHEGALDYVKQAQAKLATGPVAHFLTQLEPTLQTHLSIAKALSQHLTSKVQGRR